MKNRRQPIGILLACTLLAGSLSVCVRAEETDMTGLVPIDDLSTIYSSEEADNFWDVFGNNTDYVIDPEETMADNFSFTIVYGTNAEEYETPEIIEKIDAFLREERE